MLSLDRDLNVNPELIAAGEELLHLYDEINQAIVLDRHDKNRHGTQLCLAFYAAKLQRVTRAALTLIVVGQGEEAASLIREQSDFVNAFSYYHKHPDQAVLFMASEALQKRDMARQVMEFDDKARNDPERQRQLTELEALANEAYREYSGLRRPKGKSAKSSNPVMIDWSELDPKAMLADLLDGWLRQYYTDKEQAFTEEQLAAKRDAALARIHFLRNKFVSQAKHGTAFSLPGVLVVANGRIQPIEAQVDDPNGLAFHFFMNALPPLKVLRDFNKLGAFEERLNRLGDTYENLRSILGIEEEPIPSLDPR